MNGLHVQYADISSGNSFAPYKTVKDYDDGLKRIDGFIVYHHLNPAGPCDGATINYFCSLLLGDSAASPRRARN